MLKFIKQFFYKYKFPAPRFSNLKVFEIVEQIRYGQPKIYCQNFKEKYLKNYGVNINKPIYIIEQKKTSKIMLKSLWVAQKIKKFSLVVFYEKKPSVNIKKMFKSEVIFLKKNLIEKSFFEVLLNLNINHSKMAKIKPLNFKEITFEDRFNYCYKIKKYGLFKHFENDDFQGEMEEVFFKGKFYFFKIYSKNAKKMKILVKKHIKIEKFDYFTLIKHNFCCEINSLLYDKKLFFLSQIKIGKAELNRVKLSNDYVFECEISVDFFTGETRQFCFYFGEENFNIFIPFLRQKLLSFQRDFLQVNLESKNKKLNLFFNQILPQKILLDELKFKPKSFDYKGQYLNFSFDEILEFYKAKNIDAKCCYELIKNKLVLQNKNNFFFLENELDSYCLKFLLGENVWNVEVEKSNENKLLLDNVEFVNVRTLSLENLKLYKDIKVYIRK